MERLTNRVLKVWSKHPGLPSLKRDGLRERIANDIVNSMRDHWILRRIIRLSKA